MKITVAFYKGKGTFANTLIRWWTKSKYSHTELIIDGIWYTADPQSGKVVERALKYNPKNWDFIEISIQKQLAGDVKKQYYSVVPAKYDWLGIIMSQVFPLGIDGKTKYFCSELNIKMLKAVPRYKKIFPLQCNEYSPADMFRLLKKKCDNDRLNHKFIEG